MAQTTQDSQTRLAVCRRRFCTGQWTCVQSGVSTRMKAVVTVGGLGGKAGGGHTGGGVEGGSAGGGGGGEGGTICTTR